MKKLLNLFVAACSLALYIGCESPILPVTSGNISSFGVYQVADTPNTAFGSMHNAALKYIIDNYDTLTYDGASRSSQRDHVTSLFVQFLNDSTDLSSSEVTICSTEFRQKSESNIPDGTISNTFFNVASTCSTFTDVLQDLQTANSISQWEFDFLSEASEKMSRNMSLTARRDTVLSLCDRWEQRPANLIGNGAIGGVVMNIAKGSEEFWRQKFTTEDPGADSSISAAWLAGDAIKAGVGAGLSILYDVSSNKPVDWVRAGFAGLASGINGSLPGGAQLGSSAVRWFKSLFR